MNILSLAIVCILAAIPATLPTLIWLAFTAGWL